MTDLGLRRLSYNYIEKASSLYRKHYPFKNQVDSIGVMCVLGRCHNLWHTHWSKRQQMAARDGFQRLLGLDTQRQLPDDSSLSGMP